MNTDIDQTGKIATADGAQIAYRHIPGQGPGVLFCCGFHSDMGGNKATRLHDFAVRTGRQYTRFDYQGHGASSGSFRDGTIGTWLSDALEVLDKVTEGPQVIVGSSMGGWMAMLLARARPEKVAGLLEEIAKRKVSILLVEQKLTIALRISHRVYVMGHGHMVFEGTPEALRSDAQVRSEWLEV